MDYLNSSSHAVEFVPTLELYSEYLTTVFVALDVFSVEFRMWYVSLFLLLSVALLVGVTLSRVYWKSCSRGEGVVRGKRVMMFIAHPDDECMFFGPTILHLTRTCVDLHLVCLTDGDYYGDGDRRYAELRKSCATLGINMSNLKLIRDDCLPDDPNVDWDPKFLAELISWHIVATAMDAFITFDSYGVSGHRNHIAISRAVDYLISRGRIPPTCVCYALKSEPLLLKYTAFLTVPFKRHSPNVYIATEEDHNTIKEAMSQHASQYVWFRKLFVRFSTYSYLNTLTPIEILYF